MNPQVETQEQQQQLPQDAAAAAFAAQAVSDAKETVKGNLLDSVIKETDQKVREQVILQLEGFRMKQRLASLFAASGCFADVKGHTPEQAMAAAFVKIELGEAMGFTPAESMQGIDLISGKPAVNAQLRAARMQRAGFTWEIDWFDDTQGNCIGCRLWLYRQGKPLLQYERNEKGEFIKEGDGQPRVRHVSVAFMKRDAEMLKTKSWEGVPRGGTPRTVSVLEKDNWKNTPRNMYFARAITNAQRWYAPGCLSGDIPSTEELLDMDVEQLPVARATAARTEELRERLQNAQNSQTQAPATDSEPAGGKLFNDPGPIANSDPNDSKRNRKGG